MLWSAKGGRVDMGDTDMDYISFGNGSEVLVMLPGLGEGLTTVRGTSMAMALAYRMYAKEYRVYLFGRKNHLREGDSTRDMARDQAQAMKLLGITKAKVLGISQGGMLAQYLAIDYPDLVEKLVLAVTLSRQNEIIQGVVGHWIELARQEKYKDLILDTVQRSYSEQYLKKYRWLYPFLGKVGKPKDSSRFLIQAAACMGHDAYGELGGIVCPTLVVGGTRDNIVGAASCVELADKIKNSELFLYKGLGHAAYEEAKDFHSRVLEYLRKERADCFAGGGSEA